MENELKVKSVNALKNLQTFFNEFFAKGGKVEDLKKGTPEYAKIKNANIFLENGRRATMNEKFELCGVEKPVRRLVSIEEISRRLQEFVDAGGNVDELGVEDEIYQLVKSIDNKHTLEEKFKICGQIRHSKKSTSSWDDLKREAHQYVADGKSLHIERKKLPFYDTLHTAKRSYFRKYGKKITSKEALERVGVKGYSDIYYNFLDLFELEKHKDTYGYVDSYRKNLPLNATIDRYAEFLDMPVALVVELVADQKLEKCFIQTDTISFVSQQLKEFKENYGSFDNISRIDPQLYNRLSRLKKIVKTDSGKPVSTRELVEMLGQDDATETFSEDTSIYELDFDTDVAPLIQFAKSNGNTISAKNIPHSTYRMILDYVTRNATNISDFFAEFGVNYTDARANRTFVKLAVDKFPYISEMKNARNQMAKQMQIEHPEFTKEEYFEQYLEICKTVYQKFKPLIENYGLNEDFDSSQIKRSNPSTFGE